MMEYHYNAKDNEVVVVRFDEAGSVSDISVLERVHITDTQDNGAPETEPVEKRKKAPHRIAHPCCGSRGGRHKKHCPGTSGGSKTSVMSEDDFNDVRDCFVQEGNTKAVGEHFPHLSMGEINKAVHETDYQAYKNNR